MCKHAGVCSLIRSCRVRLSRFVPQIKKVLLLSCRSSPPNEAPTKDYVVGTENDRVHKGEEKILLKKKLY